MPVYEVKYNVYIERMFYVPDKVAVSLSAFSHINELVMDSHPDDLTSIITIKKITKDINTENNKEEDVNDND